MIFWFIQFSLNRYRSSPILIESISYVLEWTFSVRFYNSIEFSSVAGCQQRWLTRSLLLFITVPRCFKPPYIVGSGCPVSRDISGCPVSRDISGSPVSRDISGCPVSRDISGSPVSRDNSGSPVSRDISGSSVSRDIAGLFSPSFSSSLVYSKTS